jgi:nitric oxide reductase subunit B
MSKESSNLIERPTSFRRLWGLFAFVVLASFAVLGGFGYRIASEAPPVPDEVTAGGKTLFDDELVRRGQNVWQSLGGQEIGTVWGHGAYVAPDWSADWLHRELTFILDRWAREKSAGGYAALPAEEQAALRARLKGPIRTNIYDPVTHTLTLDPVRAAAFEANAAHFADLFGKGRPEYAIPAGTLTDPGKPRAMAAFFFWTSWACATNRPGMEVSYTQNWPHEPLIDNVPTADAVLWSVFSLVLLLAGVGGMVWYFAAQPRGEDDSRDVPGRDPFLGYRPTPSQRATLKYFFVVGALLVLQIVLGVLTAHYGVEGSGFYGIPLDRVLPYAVTRTWHTQLGIFWIATAWLATGLYVAPAVSGGEPRGQRLLVNLLFGALLVIVVGSLAGEWASAKQLLPGDAWFWVGHQGYEYVDMGRLRQLLLLAGLFLWLFLMGRALLPALRRPGEHRPLLALFLISSLAIALFYAAGLDSGGIIGTFHHLYFAGTPPVVMALGAVFSALEVVPLVLVGFEAWENVRLAGVRDWVGGYRWAIWFFVAVAFWNMVGAGLFGFMINPPIALYYMQGLNTTPVRGHTALFGFYGMLGLGLMLFCVRGLMPGREWRTGPVAFSFWAINAGLLLMVTVSLLPVGLMQAWATVNHGTWYARSAEFLQTPTMNTLRWLRVIGDTIFALGVLAMDWFKLGLLTGHSVVGQAPEVPAGRLTPEPEPAGAA